MMKYLLAIVVLAAALQLSLAVDREKAKEVLHDYRIKNQNLQIDELEEEVEKLEAEFGELGDIPDENTINALKARIRNLEGTGCDADHVQCGGDVPECISPLFVCDGHDDCKNGRDEDDDVCSLDPVKVGSTYAGITSWSDCVVHSPHMTVITITASERPKAYTARVYVRAVVSFEVDEHSHLVQSYSAKGYWDFGHHRLNLIPSDSTQGGGHGISCSFNLGNHQEADCKIGLVSSKHECGAFHAKKV